MDPLGMTASILTVLGVAKLLVKGLDKATDLRKAPAEVAHLLEDLRGLCSILENIVTHLESTRDARQFRNISVLGQHVAKADQLVKEIDLLTNTSRLSRLNFSDKNAKRVAWLQNRSKIKSLEERLHAVKTNLSLAFDSLHAQNLDHSIRMQNETTSKLDLVLEKLTKIESESASYDSVDESPMLATPGDFAPEESDHTMQHTAVMPRAIPQDPPSWRVNPPRKSRCLEWCSCQCHSKLKLRAPWFLKTVFGLSTVEYMASQNPCNDRSCRGRQFSGFGMTFTIPKYLLSRYILIALTYTPSEGPQISLQIPRVMPWSHPLFMYANQGNIQAMRNMFIEGKASVRDVNPRGCSALMYTARFPKVLKALTDDGGDLSLRDERGRCPADLLGNLLLSGQLDSDDAIMAKFALDTTDYEETRGFSTLHKIVLGLSGKDIDSELADPLVKIDPVDSSGMTPLKWAVIRNDYAIVTRLIQHGADPNIRDDSGSSAIHDAHDVRMCELLISKGADLHNKTDTYGRTCLHSVCRRGDFPDVIGAMIAAGADIDARNADNETPLMNAIFKRSIRTTEYLVDHGASLDAANTSSGDGPVHFAVSFNNHEALRLLLKNGVDYTAVNVHGRNIAHMAAMYGNAGTLSIMVQGGLDRLDTTLRDEEHKSPAGYLGARLILAESEAGVHAIARKLLENDHSSPTVS